MIKQWQKRRQDERLYKTCGILAFWPVTLLEKGVFATYEEEPFICQLPTGVPSCTWHSERSSLHAKSEFGVPKPHFSCKLPQILVIMMFMACTLVFGVSGIVLDSTGKPITGAAITDLRKAVYSKSDGSFSIQTKADSLYISRPGFQKKSISTKDFTSPILLQPSDIVLPTVWVRENAYKAASPSLSPLMIHPDTNSKAESTNELLLANPSFSTVDNRLMGERQTVSLLGSLNRHSLVMLDGIALNAAGEAFDFSKIPVDQISHIEVIKGNSSVYGGSAAIGGIIHIHTKEAAHRAKWEGGLGTTLGSFGLTKQVYNAAYSKNQISANLEYSHYSADNDFEYNTPEFWQMEPELKRTHNRKVADSIFGKASFGREIWQLDYGINAGSFVRELPGPVNFLDLYDDSKLAGAYAQHSLRGIITHKLMSHEILTWWNTDGSTFSNLASTNGMGRSHYSQSQVNRGVKASSNLAFQSTKMEVMAEYSHLNFAFENLISTAKTEALRENRATAYKIQQNIYLGAWEYQVGGAVRGDFSQSELHPTWRFEHKLIFPLASEVSLGGFVGTAFSRPSLYDMYWIGDSETQGNPDLKSESSWGYSAFGDVDVEILKLHAAYYYNKIDDLIQWRQYYLNGVSWKPFNVGKAELQNLELEATLSPKNWLSLSGGITYTKAHDLSTLSDGSPSPSYNKKLPYTPDKKARASLKMADEVKGITFSYVYSGEQYSTSDNLIDPLPAFDTLDGSGFYRIKYKKATMQIDAKVNNILNERYEIYAYIPQPGINFTIGTSLGVKW